MLEDQENFCKLHSDHGAVKTFRCLIMDQEVSLNQLEYEVNEGMRNNEVIMEPVEKDFPGNLEDFAMEQCSPSSNFNVALEESDDRVSVMTTVRNQDWQANGDIMEQKERDLSGNLYDFSAEQRPPSRDFNIALEDSTKERIGETTVRNPEGTTRDNTDVERDGGSLEHDEINPPANLSNYKDSTENELEETTVRNPDSGGLMEQDEKSLSGNLDDFAEELRPPVRISI